ncbi:MAG: SLBB domain-containing protein [Treponemataceae bacterium]|nr:SLBB domain-containing protein [Treponemataceae bacterium]
MRKFLLALLFGLAALSAFAQSLSLSNLSAKSKKSSSDNNISLASQSGNVQIAMSVPDYLVTAGDIYTLSFVIGTDAISYSLPVDSTYRIRVANLGVIDASGKTFVELKRQVENLVTRNYPMSGVQFVLTSAAVFKVTIKGEVFSTTEKNVWALTRLSALLKESELETNVNNLDPYADESTLFEENELLTKYSSKRNIVITSADGKSKTYDLFKAERFGDMTQDPYLRPNDVITISRFQRIAMINGTVERPGTYELLEGENLKDLVEVYGGGLAPRADTTRIEVTHINTETEKTGGKTYVSQSDIDENYKIESYDTIYIPTYKDLRPSIFIEGAVVAVQETDTGSVSLTSSDIKGEGMALTSSEIKTEDMQSTNRLTIAFSAGEKYTSFVRGHSQFFSSPVADTANSYIMRDGDKIPISIYKILYDKDFDSDEILQSNDTLVVPFKQYFVSVSGAVKVPGRYPYIPDRGWEYYISLAGGFTKTENSRQKIVITDIDGKKLSKKDPITPEATIEAVTNSGLYYFNLYAPIITTLISAVSTSISILAVTGVLSK